MDVSDFRVVDVHLIVKQCSAGPRSACSLTAPGPPTLRLDTSRGHGSTKRGHLPTVYVAVSVDLAVGAGRRIRQRARGGRTFRGGGGRLIARVDFRLDLAQGRHIPIFLGRNDGHGGPVGVGANLWGTCVRRRCSSSAGRGNVVSASGNTYRRRGAGLRVCHGTVRLDTGPRV
ncbi:unnamed protein product [Sphacelaria rigidula]